METNNLKKLYQLICNYYPKQYDYLSREYQTSEQHKRLKKILNNDKQRKKKNKLIYFHLNTTFQNNYIKNWTSMDYPSIHYTMLLHENQPILDDDEELLDALNNRRLDLEIYISLLGNYYYAFVVETLRNENKELSFTYYQDDVLLPDDSRRLNHCMKQLGYYRLDRITVHRPVAETDTELKNFGEVTIFHCLFSDLESNY